MAAPAVDWWSGKRHWWTCAGRSTGSPVVLKW